MPFDYTKYAPLVTCAVAHYWTTLEKQSEKNKQENQSDADRGGRSAVTGGKQMDGFCAVVNNVLIDSGLPEAEIYIGKKLELPGYFRPTKNWDMLVVSKGELVAAMEFKSQRGPSFGNNFNNRSEEAIGTAHDLRTAYRDGALGKNAIRPWLGWVMLLEDCPDSTKPVQVKEPHFKVFPEFERASYAKRYELLLRRLVKEDLYNQACLLLATASGGPRGEFSEPAEDLTMRAFLASLGGHIDVHVASRKQT
jgi:hypothetical protein